MNTSTTAQFGANRTSNETVEACAKIAEAKALEWYNGEASTTYGQGYQTACRQIADAIRSLGHAQAPAGPSFGAVLDLAQEGLDRWREKPHNAKWWRRIDGTPIPNDLLVNIADVIATSLSSTDREGK